MNGMEEAAKAGIVSGMTPMLAPQAKATSAQAAMIYKLLTILGK